MCEGIIQFVEDKNTKTWDKYWKRIPVYDSVLDLLRKIMNLQLKKYLKKFASINAKTLEPGGGSAYVSAMLIDEGREAYALDYALAPLKLAQQQLKSKAVLIQGDMFNMPFSDEVFDVTFNNSTMEHFPRERALAGVREMTRVTKKGGYVFVGVPFTYGPLCLYKLKKNSFKGAWDGKTYDRKELKKLFADAGLEVAHCRTFFFRCFVGVMGKKI
jgi:ubiquinone/menaquinone biosynthesis C-methylase UbiE